MNPFVLPGDRPCDFPGVVNIPQKFDANFMDIIKPVVKEFDVTKALLVNIDSYYYPGVIIGMR